ncbi:hypothetical protein ACKKBF_B04985 [Auxenochlorella protothecoides x Auxenochlorella symbiontica]
MALLLRAGAAAVGRHAGEGPRGPTPLLLALLLDHPSAALALLRGGADPDLAVAGWPERDAAWPPLLRVAVAARCRPEIVAALLAAGAAPCVAAVETAVDADLPDLVPLLARGLAGHAAVGVGRRALPGRACLAALLDCEPPLPLAEWQALQREAAAAGRIAEATALQQQVRLCRAEAGARAPAGRAYELRETQPLLAGGDPVVPAPGSAAPPDVVRAQRDRCIARLRAAAGEAPPAASAASVAWPSAAV